MPLNNCSLGNQQKLLLKVLNCLAAQYFTGKTGNTTAFMANPSEEGYEKMKNELSGIVACLQSSQSVLNLALPAPSPAPLVRIISTFADGKVAFDSSRPSGDNTYFKAVNNTVNPDNYGTRKGWQVLNTDESASQSTQIKPAVYSADRNINPPTIRRWVTEARLVERTGCPGLSNTGFVALSLEVDIHAYSFKTPCASNC
jgi:hypothetical protein